MKTLVPSYDPAKEWEMDPKGYFLVKVFYSKEQIGVRHVSPENETTHEIYGSDSYTILQTLVREGLVTTIQHAAYLGHELHRAEMALRLKVEYVQDFPLDTNKRFTHDPSENLKSRRSNNDGVLQ